MAAAIIQRLFSGVPDNKVLISNCSIARLIEPSVISNWNHLRIAIRVQIAAPLGSWIIDSPVFAFGLCSGITNPWNNGLLTTTHFVGVKTKPAFWQDDPVFGRFLLTGIDGLSSCKRIGTTETIGPYMSLWQLPHVSFGKRDALFVDFERDGGNLKINTWYNNSVDSPDFGYDDFIDIVAFENPAYPRLPALDKYAWGTEDTVAVNEGVDGVLNAINFASNRVNHIEVSDAVVVRFG